MTPTKPGLYEVKIGAVGCFIEFNGEKWHFTNGDRAWPSDDAEFRGPLVVEGETDTFRRQIAKTQYLDESAGWPEIVSKLVMGAPASADVLIDWEAITSTIGRHTARYALEARYPTLGSLPVMGEREIYVGPCELGPGVWAIQHKDREPDVISLTVEKFKLGENYRAIRVGDVPEFPPAPPPEPVMPDGPPPRFGIARRDGKAVYCAEHSAGFYVDGCRFYKGRDDAERDGWEIQWLDEQEGSGE